MTISPETIAAVFTGLTGLIGGIAAYMSSRSRRIDSERRQTKRQLRDTQRQLLASVQHMFALELQLANHGLPVPDRPLILEPLDDDDPDAAAPEDRSPGAGTHRR